MSWIPQQSDLAAIIPDSVPVHLGVLSVPNQPLCVPALLFTFSIITGGVGTLHNEDSKCADSVTLHMDVTNKGPGPKTGAKQPFVQMVK